MPLNFLHPFGFICRFPPFGLSTTSCVYAASISEFLLHPVPLIKLPTFPAFIRFQYLCFPLTSLQLLAFILFQHLNFPPVPQQPSCFHLVPYVGPPWPPSNFLQASRFNILKLSHTCASQQLPALMRFQYLRFSPSSLHNFLHASSFGLIIFCAHMV